jgi:hypothetical protein
MSNVSDIIVLESICYLQVSGSRLYGTFTETSDYDARGVCILEDPAFYFGWQKFEQKDKWSSGEDKVVYDIRKALKLICDGNPNMVELLFTPDEFVIFCDDDWQKFRDVRYETLSQQMVDRYFGWAYSEYKKIMNKSDNGINGKQMSHSVRLLRMLHELLVDGEIYVVRKDAEELLAIRSGSWNLETYEAWYHHIQAKIKEAQKTTSLKKNPNRKLIESMLCKIIQERIKE